MGSRPHDANLQPFGTQICTRVQILRQNSVWTRTFVQGESIKTQHFFYVFASTCCVFIDSPCRTTNAGGRRCSIATLKCPKSEVNPDPLPNESCERGNKMRNGEFCVANFVTLFVAFSWLGSLESFSGIAAERCNWANELLRGKKPRLQNRPNN